MAQDVVLAKPLSTQSMQERLTLFAELDGEPGQSVRTTKAKMLALGTEAEVTGALMWMLQSPLPCAPERIIAYLTALAVMHPMQGIPQEAASLKFRIFCEDLGHIPEAILQEACRLYRRDQANTFFPTPGKLLAICAPMLTASSLQRRGAERMLRTMTEPEAVHVAPAVAELSEERKARLEAILNKFRRLQEAEREFGKPAEQEVLDANGALSPERRAQLRALREKVLAPSAA